MIMDVRDVEAFFSFSFREAFNPVPWIQTFYTPTPFISASKYTRSLESSARLITNGSACDPDPCPFEYPEFPKCCVDSADST
jgi:hypothetical protein